MWDDLLTDQEVFDLYQKTANNYTELSALWTPQWSNMVGYWRMEGNWQDSSSNNNHGTPLNSPNFTEGVVTDTNAGTFVSVNSQIEITDSPESVSYTHLTLPTKRIV